WEVFDFGEHILDEPLLKRPFLHGVRDCYELIRSWFWQNRLDKLLPMPRDEGWWGDPENGIAPTADLYLEHFKACGAERIYPRSQADLKPGDVFLFKLKSERYNHGGVFIGNGKAIHHAPNRFSQEMIVTDAWFNRPIWLRK